MKRLPWQVNAGIATLCAGVGVMDGVGHEWWGIPVMAAGLTVNGLIARHSRTSEVKHDAEAHRPDYAKIARLEVELGLVPPPKQKTSVAAWAGSVSNGVLPPRYVVTRASGGPCWAPTSGRGMKCYSDCGVMPWGKCPYQPR